MTNTQPTTSGRKIYLRLLGYMRPDIAWLMIGFAGFLVYAACDSAFAWWMKELVDSIEQSDTRAQMAARGVDRWHIFNAGNRRDRGRILYRVCCEESDQ